MPETVAEKVEELMTGQTKGAVNVITTTEEEYKKIKDSNDKLEKELARQEQLRAQQLLGGKSLLGQTQEKTKEEIAKEDASNILKTYGFR